MKKYDAANSFILCHNISKQLDKIYKNERDCEWLESVIE